MYILMSYWEVELVSFRHRILPSPPIPTLHTGDTAELIGGIQRQWNVNILSDDQVNKCEPVTCMGLRI